MVDEFCTFIIINANNKSIKEISKKYPKSYMTQHGYTTNNLLKI